MSIVHSFLFIRPQCSELSLYLTAMLRQFVLIELQSDRSHCVQPHILNSHQQLEAAEASMISLWLDKLLGSRHSRADVGEGSSWEGRGGGILLKWRAEADAPSGRRSHPAAALSALCSFCSSDRQAPAPPTPESSATTVTATTAGDQINGSTPHCVTDPFPN